jgi:hypothetical protein
VKTHSLAAAWYAAKAVWARDPEKSAANVRKERLWQYKRLIQLSSMSGRTVTLSWKGALTTVAPKTTSVDLQHKISRSWAK